MSRSFNAAGAQGLSASSTALTAPPLTMACWFNVDTSVNAVYTLMGLWAAGNSNHGYVLHVAASVAGDPVRAGTKAASTTYAFAATPVGYTPNTWQHACGVFSALNSRTVYLDGGNTNTDTTNKSTTGIDTWGVGLEADATPAGLYMSGRIAEAAYWSVALTADEVAALARGVRPLLIRPASLVGYFPLIGRVSPEPNLMSAGPVGLTLSGSPPTAADHPRIFGWPRARHWLPPAAAGGTVVELSVGGSLGMTGAIVRRAETVLASSIPSAGAVTWLPSRSYAGVLGSSGAILRVPNRAFASLMAGSGIVARAPAKLMAGTLAAAGALGRLPAKNVAASMAVSGAVLKQPARLLISNMPGSGSLVRVPAKPSVGTLPFAGALSRTSVGVRSGAGTLPSVGALLQTGIGVRSGAGTLLAAGALAKVVEKWVTPAPYVDMFTRANEYPLAFGWSRGGPAGLALVDTHLQGDGTLVSGLAAEYRTALTSMTDQFSECVIIDTAGSPNLGGPCVRMLPSSLSLTCYAALVYIGSGGGGSLGAGTSTLEVVKYVSGTKTILASYTGLIIRFYDRIKLTAIGTTLRVYINDAPITPPLTDASLSVGAPGLGTGFEFPLLDNWAGGPVQRTLPFAGALTRVPTKYFGGPHGVDHFNRANDIPLAGNWAAGGPNSLVLLGNHVQAWESAHVDPPGLSVSYWSADAFSADQYSQCIITEDGGSPYPVAGPCVRVAPTTLTLSCYHAAVSRLGAAGLATLTLHKYAENVRTALATYTGLTVNLGDTIRLTVKGSTLRTYVNGVEIGTAVSDTTLLVGAPGIGIQYLETGTPNCDDWMGGTLPKTVAGTSALVRVVEKWIDPRASDNFTRANEAVLAAPWDILGPNSWNLNDTHVNPSGGSPVTPPGVAGAHYGGAPSPSNSFAQCEIYSTATTVAHGGPAVRMGRFLAGFPTSGSDYLTCYAADTTIAEPRSTSQIVVKKIINNLVTTLATITTTVNFHDLIRLTVTDADLLRVYVNGALVGSVTDHDIPGGGVGMVGSNWDIYLDTWSGGALPQALTPSGALELVRSQLVELAGSLPSVGMLIRIPEKLMAGTIALIGTLTATGPRLVTAAGALLMSGALTLVRSQTIVLVGVLPSSGVLSRLSEKLFTGTVVLAGALIRVPQKISAATLPLHGTIRWMVVVVSRTGTLSLSGTVAFVRAQMVTMAGVLPMAGALIRVPSKALAGTIAAAGTVVRVVAAAFSSLLPLSGALRHLLDRLFTGNVSSTGSLQMVGSQTLTTSGTLSLAGALMQIPSKVMAGAAAALGTLRVVASMLYAGVITAAAEIFPVMTRDFTGELAPTSELINETGVMVEATGELIPEGALARTPDKTLEAALDSAGALVRVPDITRDSVLPMSGTLQQDTEQSVYGALELAGTVTWSATHRLAGVLSTAGTLTKRVIKQPFEATLEFASTLVTEAGLKFVELAGTVALAGAVVGRSVTKLLHGVLGWSGLLTFVPSIITKIGTILMVRLLLRDHGATGAVLTEDATFKAQPTLTDESTLDDTELK